jgi:hypothetical protein
MRRVGDKAFLRLICRFDTLKHLVKRLGQVAQFIKVSRCIDPCRQVMRVFKQVVYS